MAYDLLFRRRTRRNWARKATVQIPSQAPGLVLTQDEKDLLARIALCRAQAQGGDKAARKRWKKTVKQIVAIRRKAARGDVKCQRTVAVLVQSGMFPSTRKGAPRGTTALKPLVSGIGKTPKAPKEIDPSTLPIPARDILSKALIKQRIPNWAIDDAISLSFNSKPRTQIPENLYLARKNGIRQYLINRKVFIFSPMDGRAYEW
jgi:hypothetical protein